MSLDNFPRPVDNLAHLPSDVQQILAPHVSQPSDRPFIVIPPFQHIGRQVQRPGQRWGWLFGSGRPWRSPEWTLALTDDHLIVVARPAAPTALEVTVIPYQSMIAFEWGAILLYSWIEIVWADPDIRHTRIEYNTVGEPFLRSVLSTLQQAAIAQHALPPIAGRPVDVEPLFQRSMKFYNMLKLHALLPDERVFAYRFEPTIKSKWLVRRGREGLLWAVTDYHGLLIREPESSYPYGVIYSFCPRGQIRNARVTETDRDAELHLTLGAAGYEVSAAFPSAHAAELRASLPLLAPQAVDAPAPVGSDYGR